MTRQLILTVSLLVITLLLGVACNGTLVFLAYLTAKQRPAEIRALG